MICMSCTKRRRIWHRCASLVNIFEQMCLRSWNDRTFIFLRKYWFARLQFVRYECYDCDWKTMLWQAHSAEIEIHSVALGRIFKTLVCLQGIWKFTAMLVSFVFCPFLPTNCVHRQYRPIDVRVPKGDPFLVGDWCFIKGQSCKKKLKKQKKQSIDYHRFI